MSTVGQDERKAVTGLLRLDLRHRDRFTARRRDAEDRTRGIWGEQDRAVSTPRSAKRVGGVRELAHQSAADVDSFELSFCEEADRLIVRRPERIKPSLCSRERPNR